MIGSRLLIPTDGPSLGFSAAVTNSHKVVTRVEYWATTAALTSVLYPVEGSVSVDASRAVRRTATLKFVDYDGTITPTSSTSALSPGNGELRIYRGVEYSNGVQELIPLGIFVITDTQVEASDTEISISVTCDDRSRRCIDASWGDVITITSGTLLTDSIATLLTNVRVLPGNPTRIDPATYAVPSTHQVKVGGTNESPWEGIQRIAEGIGYEVWFDVDGTLLGAIHPPIPSLIDALTTYEAGSESVLLGTTRSLSINGVYNTVTLRTEGSAIPPDAATGLAAQGTGAVTSADVLTSTANVGERLLEISTSVLGTAIACQQVALLLVNKYVGFRIELEIVPDPRIDARDIIRVIDERISLDAVIVVDTVDIPLGSGDSMKITGRQFL